MVFFQYAGGKSTMLQYILPIIPKHKAYIEPFFGSGIVFWNKPPSNLSVINDINLNLYSFWKELKENTKELIDRLQSIMYHRHEFDKAKKDLLDDNASRMDKALAVFICYNQSFAGKGETWGYGNSGKNENRRTSARSNSNDTLYRKIENISNNIKEIEQRLKWTQVECRDVMKILETYYDKGDTSLLYLDPPYIDAGNGHYEGKYTEYDLINMLDLLGECNCRFILSNYKHSLIDEYIAKLGWNSIEVDRVLAVSANNPKINRSAKEIIVYNYTLENTLF